MKVADVDRYSVSAAAAPRCQVRARNVAVPKVPVPVWCDPFAPGVAPETGALGGII